MIEKIKNNIRENYRNYAIFSLILLLGIAIGIFICNGQSNEQLESIKNYIYTFIDKTKNNNKINYNQLLTQSIKNNLITIIIIVFFSISIINKIGIYLTIALKGTIMGFSMTAVINSLGTGKGIIFTIGFLLVTAIIETLSMFYLSAKGVNLVPNIINDYEKTSIKKEIISFIISIIITTISMAVASLIQTYVSSNLLICIVKYL